MRPYQTILLIWVLGSIPLALVIGFALRITGRNPKSVDLAGAEAAEQTTEVEATTSLLV